MKKDGIDRTIEIANKISEITKKFNSLDTVINPPQYPIHDMVITNPTVETNKLLKEQIELLQEQNDELKKQAESSKRDAQKSLIFGWVSFLVATIIGIGSIFVAILIK